MNPNDVFPRRNLPGESEAWGRVVEDRIREVEYAALGQKTNLQSENRASSASLQEISRQIISLQANQAALDANQAALDAAIRAVPRTLQSTQQNSGFGLGGGWNTVVTASVTVPSGMNTCRLLVIGSGQVVTNTTTQNVESSYRLNVLNVGTSPEAPGPWATGYGDFRTVLTPSYGWTFGVSGGQNVTAEFQVQPRDGGAYPPNGNSYAVLTLLATFSG